MSDQNNSREDWVFIAPMGLVAICLIFWRRAKTISDQFGYEMWSREMWLELRFQFVTAILLVLAVAVLRWLWTRR